MKSALRDYQQKALDVLAEKVKSGENRILFHMIVGSGRPLTAIAVVKELSIITQFRKVLLVTDRIMLSHQFSLIVRQHYPELSASEVSVNSIGLSSSYLEICTLQALRIKGRNVVQDFDAIILDDPKQTNTIEKIHQEFKGLIIAFTSVLTQNILKYYGNDVDYSFTINEILLKPEIYVKQQSKIDLKALANLQTEIDKFYETVNTENVIDVVNNFKKIANKFSGLMDTVSEMHGILNSIMDLNIGTKDLSNIIDRKKSLDKFEKLLTDPDFFEQEKISNASRGDEAVWQQFFEENTWIFGYGLQMLYNSPLEGKKLEQVVSGYDVNSAGKRVDALLQSNGIVNTLCFAEIKLHTASLLGKEYRSECFSVSNEVIGGVAQVHKTVDKSLKALGNKLSLVDKEGFPTGKDIFNYQPKSYLIIGNLNEFKNDKGQISERQFSSFELFRRNILNPTILTFDELYERASFIVKTTKDGN